MPMFDKGDKVKSNTDAQGLKKGQEYTVADVHHGSFGTVTYIIQGEDGKKLSVVNGHLLLTPVHESVSDMSKARQLIERVVRGSNPATVLTEDLADTVKHFTIVNGKDGYYIKLAPLDMNRLAADKKVQDLLRRTFQYSDEPHDLGQKMFRHATVDVAESIVELGPGHTGFLPGNAMEIGFDLKDIAVQTKAALDKYHKEVLNKSSYGDLQTALDRARIAIEKTKEVLHSLEGAGDHLSHVAHQRGEDD